MKGDKDDQCQVFHDSWSIGFRVQGLNIKVVPIVTEFRKLRYIDFHSFPFSGFYVTFVVNK